MTMWMFIRNQKNRLADYLPYFKALPLSHETPDNLPREEVRMTLPRAAPDLRRYDFGFLFRYDVFPKNVLEFFGEWELHGRELAMGDTIVQQAQVPPCRAGLKLIFGSRVLTAYRTETKAGFGYGTLVGHPEAGTNEFAFIIEGGSLFAVVRTTAVPVLRFVPATLVRRYVRFCNRKAAHGMRSSFFRFNGSEEIEGD